jgi:hypothetical protein
MYQPLLELFPASNLGATLESGTDSGSILFVGFASGTALGSTATGAIATAVAVPALAAAEREPEDFDGVGFGNSAIATAAGAAVGAGFWAAAWDVDGDGATTATVSTVSGAALGFNRSEISATVHRDFASRRNVLRTMSRKGCGTLSGKPGSPAVSSGRRCVNDSTIVAPSDHESPAFVALPFVSGATKMSGLPAPICMSASRQIESLDNFS